MNSEIAKDSPKKRKYKIEPKRAILIRSIFEIDDSLVQPKKKNLKKINYDKNIYFQKSDDSNDLQKIITNVMKNPKNNEIKENIFTNNNILYNKNIEKNNDVNNNQNNNELQKKNSLLKQSLSRNNRNLNKKLPKLNFDFPKIEENELMSVPCINCGNIINIDDIENHSLICLKVSDEIMKNESSKYELYSIDYKLKKLKEHLLSILNKSNNINSKNNNDIEIKNLSSTLLEYIKEIVVLQKIDIQTIKKLKQFMKNLENLSIKYQNNISELILIERTKILVNEKFKIFKNTYKLEVNNRTINSSKTGEINNLDDLKLKIQQIEKNNKETGLEKKINKQIQNPYLINNTKKTKSNLISSIISEKKNEDEDSILSSQENNNDINNNIKVEEIISDVENNSNLLSINTSISNVSDIGQSYITNNNVRISNTNSKNENNEKNNEITNNQLNFNNENINNNIEDEKKDKKKFFNLFLKVKFEELHSTHKGQLINQKYIWEECKKQKIPKDKWSQFILSELNNPYKYIELEKKDRKNKSKKPSMEIITEEK